MRDYMDIGAVPYDEACQQVGTPNYDPMKARKECRVFKNMLKRIFGEPPEGARLTVKGHEHDFGIYHSVAVVFDTDNEAAVEYAFKVERETPAKWDDKALAELSQEAERI